VDLVLSADRKIVAKADAGNHKVIGTVSRCGNEGFIDGTTTFVICFKTAGGTWPLQMRFANQEKHLGWGRWQ
jgi:hypothetical protein